MLVVFTNEKLQSVKCAKDKDLQEYKYVINRGKGNKTKLTLMGYSEEEAELKLKEFLGSFTGKIKVTKEE